MSDEEEMNNDYINSEIKIESKKDNEEVPNENSQIKIDNSKDKSEYNQELFNDNKDNLEEEQKYKNQIENKSKLPFTEAEEESNAFSQWMSNGANNKSEEMDKEKLFETFLMFQKFYSNMNMNNEGVIQALNFKQKTQNEMKDKDNENLSDIQSEINKIELNAYNINELPENKEQMTNFVMTTSDNAMSLRKEESVLGNSQLYAEMKKNNYDDIPIKPSSANFIELVEKSLANDKVNNTNMNNNINNSNNNNTITNNNTNNTNTSNINRDSNINNEAPKKRIVKPVHQKKKLNISKPSKNDKKYSYYTDLLDENGHLNGDKNPKSSFINGRNDIPLNKTIKYERTQSKKKIQQEKNQNRSTDNIFSIHESELVEEKINQPEEQEKKDEKEEKEEKEEKDEKEENEQKEEDNINIEENTKEEENEADINVIKTEPKESISLPIPMQFNNNNSTISNGVSSNPPLITRSKEQIIDKKIKQLNSELGKVKEEKEKLFKIMSEYEKLQLKLNEDIERFTIEKNEFESYRESEMKKMQKEKKLLQQDLKMINNIKQQNSILVQNEKRDKEQIDRLRDQVIKLQAELKQKEISHKVSNDRMKKQIDELINASKNNNNTNSNISNNIISSNHEKSKNHTTTRISSEGAQLRGHSTNPFQKNTITKSKTANKFSQNKPNKPNEQDIKQMGNNNKLTKINTMTTTNISKQKLKTADKPNKLRNSKPGNKNVISPYTSTSNNPKPEKPNNTINNINNDNNSNYQIKSVTLTNPNINIPMNFDFSKKEEFDFILPDQYHKQEYSLIKSVTSNEGKIINLYTNNKREVIFPSGVQKEIYEDGYQLVTFTNGDLKQMFPNGKSVYYFNEAKTVQSTFPDGLQVFKFSTGQIEKHYLDGTKQISFPDGSLRYILNDGYEETHYADGTIQKIDKDNLTIIEHQDGSKEVKYPDGKEEYISPNGEIKEIGDDGIFDGEDFGNKEDYSDDNEDEI